MTQRLPFIATVLLVACPQVVSSRCKPCGADDECAPQGLRCLEGRCAEAPGECAAGGGSETGGGSAGGGSAGGFADAGGRDAGVGVLPALGNIADASTLFEDDFESGNILEASGGRWTRIEHGDAVGQTLNVVRDSGPGGAALVLSDFSTSNGAPEYGVFAAQDVPDVTGDVYFRTQVWLSAGAVTGPHAIAVYSDQLFQTVASEFILRGDVILQASNRTRADQCALAGMWPLGTWAPVDLLLANVGTDAGVATLRINGERCVIARDWSGARLSSFAFGASAMDNRWVGQLKFDNVAVTVGGPAPSSLRLVLSSPLVADTCAPVRLELHDSFDGGLARAVRPVRVALDGGAFYAAGCAGSALQMAIIPRGAAALELGLRAPPGSVPVSAADLGGDLSPAFETWQLSR